MTDKDADVLLAIKQQPGWRPAWRGALTRCRQMERGGLVMECGISSMPPHVVFCLTRKGENALLKHCAENF